MERGSHFFVTVQREVNNGGLRLKKICYCGLLFTPTTNIVCPELCFLVINVRGVFPQLIPRTYIRITKHRQPALPYDEGVK